MIILSINLENKEFLLYNLVTDNKNGVKIMEKKNTLFKNTIYKSILSMVNIFVPIIIGPYIMRLLDVDLYGMYNRVFADFQMFLAFAGFGVYTLGVREISKIRDDKEKVSKLFTNLFMISMLSNLLVLIMDQLQ